MCEIFLLFQAGFREPFDAGSRANSVTKGELKRWALLLVLNSKKYIPLRIHSLVVVRVATLSCPGAPWCRALPFIVSF